MNLEISETAVRHKKVSPVFVIGSTRSGTTMLVRLLRKYFHINYGPETQFIVRYYRTLSAYGNLKNDDNFHKLAKDISSERFFKRAQKNFGFVFDVDRLMRSNAERTFPSLLSHIFKQFAEQQNMTRWGDKTPAYLHDLPVLDRLFPDAQYIHIVRDGRDVALSQFNTHFGPKNVFRAAKEWKTAVSKIQQFKNRMPSSKFIEFRYEDLLENPIPVFEKLINFLDISDIDSQVIETIKSNIDKDLRKNNYFKWKKQFSLHQKKLFEREAADMLSLFNYHLIYKNLKSVSVYEKLFWEMNHYLKKAVRRDSWQDNLYRLRVKCKHVLRFLNRMN